MLRRDLIKLGVAAAIAPGTALGQARDKPQFTGLWEVKMGQLDSGEEVRVYYDLKQVANTLVGSGLHLYHAGRYPIVNGTINGNLFEFWDKEVSIHVKGKWIDGQLDLTADYGTVYAYSSVFGNEVEIDGPVPAPRHRFVATRVSRLPATWTRKRALPSSRDLPANRLAATPFMGWVSSQLPSNARDGQIFSAADKLLSLGLRDAGYRLIQLPSGWAAKRTPSGALGSNSKFPDMKRLGDYLHEHGFKLGLTTSPGPYIDAYPGSFEHEEQDARTLADWGVDYLQYDWDTAESVYTEQEQRQVYQRMAEALRASGRNIAFGARPTGDWARLAGINSRGLKIDVDDDWNVMMEAASTLQDYSSVSGSGCWLDPGPLWAGGSGMTAAEYRTQMTLWCISASVLNIATPPERISSEGLKILSHVPLIAISQDPAGKPGTRIAKDGSVETWRRDLQSGHAIALFNYGKSSENVKLDCNTLGLNEKAELHELWSGDDVPVANGVCMLKLAPHDVKIFRAVAS